MDDYVSVIFFTLCDPDIRGQKGCPGAGGDGKRRCLDPYLVPQSLIDEALKGDCSALDNERLALLGIESLKLGGEVGLMRKHDPLRVGTAPVAHVELRMLTLISDPADQDGVVLGPELMNEHAGESIRELQRTRLDAGESRGEADEAVCGLRPFKEYERPMIGMEGEEALVEPPTRAFEHADGDLRMPRPRTSAKGSMVPTTTRGTRLRMMRSAQGGVRP